MGRQGNVRQGVLLDPGLRAEATITEALRTCSSPPRCAAVW